MSGFAQEAAGAPEDHVYCGGYRYNAPSIPSSDLDLTIELAALAVSAQSTKIELEKMGVMDAGWANWNTHAFLSQAALLDPETGAELYSITGPGFKVHGHHDSITMALGRVKIPCRRSGVYQLMLSAAGDLERKPLPDGEMIELEFIVIPGKERVCALGMEQCNQLKIFEKPEKDPAWIAENSKFLEEKTCDCICVCTCEDKKEAGAAPATCPFSGTQLPPADSAASASGASKCPFKAFFGGGGATTD